ncbi:MAG: 3-dehydroquinate synthase [Elusimicrobia bacterium]|nr:3-dehydroquinate synthase [Elusimicrobiota bacterium]
MTKTFLKRDIKTAKTVRAVCGRDLPPLTDLAPELFARAGHICLATDRGCLKKFKRTFKKMLGRRRAGTHIFVLPAGRPAKTFRALEELLSFMLKRGFSRNSLLIAAGGGSVTDLAGLAASLYMRGISWISVPTTFLGQIDAGLGGKTAVDLAGIKNMAGAFYQPALTVCDAAFLQTLGRDELSAGAGELVKYALIGPAALRRRVLKNLGRALKGETAALVKLVSACADFKLSLTARDERDKTGVRERLNFGHTAGHAFESASGGRLAHGAAVLWGMRYACLLSIKLKILKPAHQKTVSGILWKTQAPPLAAKCFDFRAFHRLICYDKKAGAGKNRFLLIERPGRIKAVNNIAPGILKGTLTALRLPRGLRAGYGKNFCDKNF